MYKLLLDRGVIKELGDIKRYPAKVYRQITYKILDLSLNPRPPDSEQIGPGYRVDVGEYRIYIETMSALEEVQAAVEGIRSAASLPIAVTMTFDTYLHTMMGISPVQAVEALYDLGIRVMGANCGNGPTEIEQVLTQMVAVKPADVFLIAQSNAGLPQYAQKKIHYDGTPEVMAAYALKMKDLGVNYIGACCGSTPGHIAAMKAALFGK
jgi:5-methyltetrahydrofolate--homocysteine methyltransferase